MKTEVLVEKNVIVYGLLKYRDRTIGEMISDDFSIGNLFFLREWLSQTDSETGSEFTDEEKSETLEEVVNMNLVPPIIRPEKTKMDDLYCRLFAQLVRKIDKAIRRIEAKKDISRTELVFLLDEIEAFQVV